MLSQRSANLAFVTLVIAACGYFAWVAEGFVTSGLLASSGLPSKFFPQLVLGVMTLCGLAIAFQYLTRGGAGGDEGENVFGSAGDARRGVLMLAVSVACYLVWREFGFIAMAVLLGPSSLLALGVRNPWMYLAVLALTGAVHLAFTQALSVQLV